VEKRRMLLIYGLLVCSNAVALTRPIIIGGIVTTVATASPNFKTNLLLWLTAMVASEILYWAFIGPVRIQERKLGLALRQSVTERLYNDVTSLPWAWHQAHHTGDTINRINTATKALFGFADNQFDYMNTFVRLIGATLLLLIIALKVGIVIACVAPPLYYAIRKFDLITIRLSEEQNLSENNLSAGLLDHIGNIVTLLALRLAHIGRNDLQGRFAKLNSIMQRDMKIAVYKWAFFNIAIVIASAIALIFYLEDQTTLTTAIAAGTIVAVFQYLQQINVALQAFGGNYQKLLRYRVDIASIHPIQQAVREVTILRPSPYSAWWKEAQLTDINFRYEDRDHHIHQLDNVSLTLARGKRIALVGSSGSGKSTLLRLLRGLHEPASGTLMIDGSPQPDLAIFASVSTLIPQDSEIFENTLRYNIAFGVDADLQSVIDMACLGPVIDPLPEKLDTDIRERGINLSGGQKQRLALARGLFAARDSSLLLLDEPTSSLDPITEAAVFDNILGGFPNACIVAAIHRLHLLDRFDHIYVMEHGRIVEDGTLADLLAKNGLLAKLYAAQKKEAIMDEV
jgi:ABC-type multidrug transport system fused ATPase/permease subunit